MPKGVYKRTDKMRENIRLSKIGNTSHLGFNHSEKVKKKMRLNNLGKKLSEITKEKIGIANRGSKNYFWKGGISFLTKRIRHLYKYRQWKSDVFTRDNFICQECDKRGGYLEAHHIKAFSKIIEENNIKTLEEALNCDELWNINNGITLCLDCHTKTDNYKCKLSKI